MSAVFAVAGGAVGGGATAVGAAFELDATVVLSQPLQAIAAAAMNNAIVNLVMIGPRSLARRAVRRRRLVSHLRRSDSDATCSRRFRAGLTCATPAALVSRHRQHHAAFYDSQNPPLGQPAPGFLP